MAMVPAKEAKEILYNMFAQNFVSITVSNFLNFSQEKKTYGMLEHWSLRSANYIISSAEYSCKLFKPNFAYGQTVWTLIRLLLEE